MLQKIDDAFKSDISSKLNGQGWALIPLVAMCRRVVGDLTILHVLGDTLANDPKMMAAAAQFPEDAIYVGEALRYVPSLLAGGAASLITKRHRALRTLVNGLYPVLVERLKRHINNEETEDKPALIMAIHSLCLHPEYLEPLREEAQSAASGNFAQGGDEMPLLDSFLRESARLNPIDGVSMRRKALQPYTFADGTSLPQGSIVSIPQRAIMRDAMYYDNPETFDGFRFASDSATAKKYTDIDVSYPTWGLGRRACPGRYYASSLLKMVLGKLILGYDFEFADAKAPRVFQWRSAVVPRSSTKVLFRRRQA
ncbi:MAG: hypothetical protein Q9212_006316 [Teloschistes hypoglaucus]